MTHVTPHYLAEQGLSENFPATFFSKIRYTDSCWFWNGFRRVNGHPYGEAFRGFIWHGTQVILAHRASWILHFGPIPDALSVCHDCPDGDCPWCVNPAHLWLGTDRDNILDMWSKGRGNPMGGHWKSGEDASNAVLTNAQADEIRKLYKPWEMTAPMLAKRFGVHPQVVKQIL